MAWYYKIALVCILALSVCSCKKETGWDVDAAIPIARTHLDLNNFFTDTIFVPDANGLLHLKYNRAIIDYTLDSLVKLPDTTLTYGYTLPSIASLPVNANDILYTSTQETDLDITNNVELVKAIIRKGVIKAEFSNTATQPLNFKYEMLSTTLWGNVFVINQDVPAGSPGNPTTMVKYYPIDNYQILMTGLTGNKVNSIPQKSTIAMASSAQADVLTGGEGLNVKVTYSEVVPEYVEGYFGQQTLNFADTTYLGFLKNLQVNNLSLQQASIQFNIINEFGVEFSSNIQQVTSINDVSNTSVVLNAGTLLNAINVNRASKTNNASNPVYPYYKSIALTPANSNLLPFIENLPDNLGYSVQAQLNPLGNVSASHDFAYYGHGLRVAADIDVPMELSAGYFKLISFPKIDLTKMKQLDNVNSAELIMQATNNYAFSAQIQGYMVDEHNNIIDSLFVPGQNLLQSAAVTSTNFVTQPASSRLVCTLNGDAIRHLKASKQIKIVSYFYLPNQPTPITIDDSSYLDLILSVNVNYHVKTQL